MAADVIDYQIFGDDMQLVEVELDPGEGVRAEVGTMTYMEGGIEMDTSLGGGDGGLLGGLFQGFKRALTGESFFITSFVYNGQAGSKGHVGFAAPYPGRIIPLDLGALGGSFLAQKDSFLCAASGIDIEVAFTKRLSAGFFGGEGFILQRLVGDGLAFVHAGGTIIERDLAAGETLRIDTGCLVAFAPTVDYDIQFVGGFKNALFGGEGLFLATVSGPGKVYLQSLPLSRLADRIISASRSSTGETRGAAGLGGDLIGGLISGE
ncbi:MAG: TIGR00266 family protein [Chloroflexota bacterium]